MSDEEVERRTGLIRRNRDVRMKTRNVSLRTTRQIATAFTSGVDWGGCSKSMIFDGIFSWRSEGYHRKPEKFARAMLKAARIEKEAERALYARLAEMIKEVRDE